MIALIAGATTSKLDYATAASLEQRKGDQQRTVAVNCDLPVVYIAL